MRCTSLSEEGLQSLSHHAGEKQDEAGQETVAFQLLEFFFYQVT